MKRLTQPEKVMFYIKRFGSITSYEAFQSLFITRLSAVIFILKQKGVKFNTDKEWDTHTNMFGEKSNFKKYSLKV